MRIIEPQELKKRRQKHRAHSRRVRVSFTVLIVVVLLGGYGFIAYQRPLPEALAQSIQSFSVPAEKVNLAWPAYGQSGVGTAGYGVLATSGAQNSAPIASVAKVITAIAVLKQKPLAVGQQGPTITIDETDVNAYLNYSNNDGSVVAVENGEQISEYQALQALLLPSSNNMAETLARWAFGSQEAYVAYANNLVKSLGMNKTHVADASGFSEQTVSTSNDLVMLGLVAMQNPVLSEIVGQKEAVIPVQGQIRNVNTQLGQNNIIGIKTGNTEAAGGCYLAAATHVFDNGIKLIMISAVVGAPDLATAMKDTIPLLTSSYAGFGNVTVAKQGQNAATYHMSWGSATEAVVSTDLNVFTWRGEPTYSKLGLNFIPSNATTGTQVGAIQSSSKIDKESVPIVVKQTVKPPDLAWQIMRF